MPRTPLVVVPRLWRSLGEDAVVQSQLLGEKDLGGKEAGTLGAQCPGAAWFRSLGNLGADATPVGGHPLLIISTLFQEQQKMHDSQSLCGADLSSA